MKSTPSSQDSWTAQSLLEPMQMLNGADGRCLVNSLPFSLPEEQTLPKSLQPTPQGCERPCLLQEKVTTKEDFISLYPRQVWKTSDNCREGRGGAEPEPGHGAGTRSPSLLDRPCAPLSPQFPATSRSQSRFLFPVLPCSVSHRESANWESK